MSSSNAASDMSSYLAPEKRIFEYPKYWAECFGAAPFLPTTREEMAVSYTHLTLPKRWIS